jgi:hypothetical protein
MNDPDSHAEILPGDERRMRQALGLGGHAPDEGVGSGYVRKVVTSCSGVAAGWCPRRFTFLDSRRYLLSH